VKGVRTDLLYLPNAPKDGPTRAALACEKTSLDVPMEDAPPGPYTYLFGLTDDIRGHQGKRAFVKELTISAFTDAWVKLAEKRKAIFKSASSALTPFEIIEKRLG